MSRLRRVRAMLPALFIGAFTAGCGIVDPCDIGTDITIDGEWFLTHVDGTPVPSTGLPIPSQPNVFLVEGLLNFETLKTANHGSCAGDEMISSGVVTAVYVTRKNGQHNAGSYPGEFEYDHRNGVVTLKALIYELPGQRFGNEFSTTADVPGIGTFRGTFTRSGLR